jgi:hypothetical protein
VWVFAASTLWWLQKAHVKGSCIFFFFFDCELCTLSIHPLIKETLSSKKGKGWESKVYSNVV